MDCITTKLKPRNSHSDSESVHMPFEISETSRIKVKKGNIETEHREITDAMQDAVNWLATQTIRTQVIITETTTVTRTA